MFNPRLGRAVVAAFLMAAAPLALASSITDLNVLWIERTPHYDYDAPKNAPAPGDVVTFTGHVRYWDLSDQPPLDVDYEWRLNGAVVDSGTITGFEPDSYRDVTWQWEWQDGPHELELVLDPDDVVAEPLSEVNNAVLIRTDALIMGFWVEESVYTWFNRFQRGLGVGSVSWEDWAQRHVARWNEENATAIYDVTPNGVEDRVRLGKVVVVPDGALPLNGGLPGNNPDRNDKTVDLMWGFSETLLDGSFYKDRRNVDENNPFYFEKSLIHELGHARYLIDCYGFDVHNTAHNGGHDSVQIWEGDTYVGGSHYMPYLAFGEVLYYNQSGGIMTGPWGFNWSPYEAGALNRIAGERARCGNMNAPCNIGEFLQELPENNHFQMVDQNGQPRQGANVRVYQSEGGASWYGKTIDDTYDLEFVTDNDGWINMGRNPFTRTGTGYEPQIRHTYGIANGLMVLRVEHQGQIWYRFVEVTDFNLEYWRGNTQDAFHTLTLDGDNAVLGDLNCDGTVNFFDIDPFVLALVDRTAFDAQFDCFVELGDMNGDGAINFFDIDPFVELLVGS